MNKVLQWEQSVRDKGKERGLEERSIYANLINHYLELYQQPNDTFLVLDGRDYSIVAYNLSLFSLRQFGYTWLRRRISQSRRQKHFKEESWQLLLRKACFSSTLKTFLKENINQL